VQAKVFVSHRLLHIERAILGKDAHFMDFRPVIDEASYVAHLPLLNAAIPVPGWSGL